MVQDGAVAGKGKVLYVKAVAMSAVDKVLGSHTVTVTCGSVEGFDAGYWGVPEVNDQSGPLPDPGVAA